MNKSGQKVSDIKPEGNYMAEKSPESASALQVYEKSIDALRDTRILSKGGIAAYGIYVVAILLALFLTLNFFTTAIAQFIGQLILVFGLLLGAGLLGAALVGYLNFRKLAIAAQLEADAFRQKAELAQQRGLLIVKLLEQWQNNDYKNFAEAMKSGTILLELDKSYQELGLSGELFSSVLTAQNNDR